MIHGIDKKRVVKMNMKKTEKEKYEYLVKYCFDKNE
jgi:hypothetical protein